MFKNCKHLLLLNLGLTLVSVSFIGANQGEDSFAGQSMRPIDRVQDLVVDIENKADELPTFELDSAACGDENAVAGLVKLSLDQEVAVEKSERFCADSVKLILSKIITILVQRNLELIDVCCDEKNAFDGALYKAQQNAQLQQLALDVDGVICEWINNNKIKPEELKMLSEFICFLTLEMADFIIQQPNFGQRVLSSTTKNEVLALMQQYHNFLEALPNRFIEQQFAKPALV